MSNVEDRINKALQSSDMIAICEAVRTRFGDIIFPISRKRLPSPQSTHNAQRHTLNHRRAAGSISGSSQYGIFPQTNATVTNNASASITGGIIGIDAVTMHRCGIGRSTQRAQ
jgi:hypothetical protein